jgi:dihydrofolate reductase
MISIICAITKNRAIGKNKDLLFKIKNDLARFKMVTSGHPIIMGRKTYESIGRALPNRTNIVISRDPNLKIENVDVLPSLEAALEKYKDEKEIFIIGGGQIYTRAIEIADKLYLTIIDKVVEDADTFFPDYFAFNKCIFKEEGEENGVKYSFIELVKG